MFLSSRQGEGMGEAGPRMPCSSCSACASLDSTIVPAGTIAGGPGRVSATPVAAAYQQSTSRELERRLCGLGQHRRARWACVTWQALCKCGMNRKNNTSERQTAPVLIFLLIEEELLLSSIIIMLTTVQSYQISTMPLAPRF